MAIDISRRVVTKYEADTSGQEKGLDRLKTKTAAFSKSLSALGEDFSASMDKLAKMNQAWDGAGKIIDLARESLKAYGDDLRLTTAAGTINIHELSEAYGGLINNHELLELAAKSQHGVLKLSQEQLDTLGKATVALTHQGFDLTQTFEKLRDAAVKGKAEGLDDLGLSIKEGATAAETMKNLMAELNKKIGDSAGLTSTASNEVQQYTVMFENLKNELMIVSGQQTVMTTKAVEFGESLKKYMPVFDGYGAFLRGVRQGSGHAMFPGGQLGEDEADAKARVELTIGKIKVTPSKDGALKQDDSLKRYADQVAKDLTDALVVSLEHVDPTKFYGSLAEVDPGLSDKYFDEMKANLEKLHDKLIEGGTRESRYSAYNDNKNASWMTKVFGAPEEFSAHIKAFGALEDAVGSSFEAMVTGSESGGKAFKKALADGMLATGKSEIVQAVKEEAWALGSLAIQDYKGFSIHQMSAAQHAAAAAAAGIGARALGAGQSSGSSSGAANSNSSHGSSGGQGQGGGSNTTTTNYIIIGDSQADDSPRMRQRSARRVVNLAAAKTSTGGSF
jgi:hypothetical protein